MLKPLMLSTQIHDSLEEHNQDTIKQSLINLQQAFKELEIVLKLTKVLELSITMI